MFPSLVERIIESYCWEVKEFNTLSSDLGCQILATRNEKLPVAPYDYECAPLPLPPYRTRMLTRMGRNIVFVKQDGPPNIIWRWHVDEDRVSEYNRIKFADNEVIRSLTIAPNNRWLIIGYKISTRSGLYNQCAIRIVDERNDFVLYDRGNMKWQSTPFISRDSRMLLMLHVEREPQASDSCDIFELHNSFIDGRSL